MTTERRAPSRLDLGVVVLAAVAAGLGFDRAFPLRVLLPVVVLAAGLPALVLQSAAHRAGERLATGLRLLVYLGSLALLFALLHHAALALLSITLPAPSELDLLVVPAGLTWLGAASGRELALRAARPGRLAVLLPTVPAWAYGVLLGPATRLDVALTAVGATCAAGQLLRSTARARRNPRRLTLAATGLLIAVAVAAVAAMPFAAALGSRPRVDPRQRLPYVELTQPAANPVDWVDVWLTDPDRLLFRADTSQTVPYWQLAVLTAFDGEQWLPPTRYTRAGLGVPPPSETAGGSAGKVTQSVTIEGLEGPFLPSVDRPVRVGPPVTAVDTDSGMLITDHAVHRGLTYTVSSIGAPSGPDGTCPSGAATRLDAALTYPPELAGQLRALVGSGCTGSFATFAHDLEQRLNSGRGNVAGVPSAGTSVGVLANFLRPGGSGTVVEFAASFALAVRAAGLPSRLVVGFAAPSTAAPSTAAPSTVAGQQHQVRGRDARLWVEVRLPGRGWTAYHPTPPQATRRGPAAWADTTITVPPSSSPSPSPSLSAYPSPVGSERGNGLPALRPVARPVALAVAGGLAGYLVAVLVVPALRRQWRRRRRLPRTRGLGAWHDVLDELAHPSARHATGQQLRTATPGSVRLLLLDRCRGATAEIGQLTGTAEGCLFTATAPTPTDIELAWKAAARIRRRLRRRAGWARRIGRVVSWRNLRPRSTWSDGPAMPRLPRSPSPSTLRSRSR